MIAVNSKRSSDEFFQRRELILCWLISLKIPMWQICVIFQSFLVCSSVQRINFPKHITMLSSLIMYNQENLSISQNYLDIYISFYPQTLFIKCVMLISTKIRERRNETIRRTIATTSITHKVNEKIFFSLYNNHVMRSLYRIDDSTYNHFQHLIPARILE